MRKLITSVVLAVATLSATSPAMAWGAREQGIVAGVVGTLIVQQLVRPPVVVAAPPPVPVPVVPWNPAVPVSPVVPYYPGTVYPDYIYRPMFKSVDVWVPECYCYRTMTVQVR